MKAHPRIVSLVPSWTETLYSFGFDAEIVGATRYCVHPEALVAKTLKIGGTKDPDVARIVELAPDLVVCDHEEQRKEDVDAMRAAGLDVLVTDVRSIDDSIRDALALGERVGKTDAARVLVERIAAAMREVARPRPLVDIPVFVPIWRRPWMTLTRDTYAHHVLSLAGARNVFGDGAGTSASASTGSGAGTGASSRYPSVEIAEALRRGATAALLPTEPYPFHAKDIATDELAAAGFDRGRVRVVDGEALTWYGAREPDGLRAIAAAIRGLRAEG